MTDRLELTPAQTVGPFFAIGLRWDQGPYAAGPDAVGAIWVRGHIYDGAGDPVPDALVETWDGELFARAGTDDDGRYEVKTRKAPHINVSVFARGLLNRVVTRIYFDADAVPDAVPEDRRDTLLAKPEGGGYRFDIVLQGEGETPFFNV
jgi:protocatechuate 3,4-dioxygenase alpha subunit